MKNKKIIIGILLILFTITTFFVVTNQIKVIDDFIYDEVMRLRNPFFDTFFVTITKFGNVKSIVIILILLTILLPKKAKAHILIGALANVSVNNIIKYIIKRPRPNHLRLVAQGGYSYPSGHTMISIAIYGYLIYLVNRKVENKKLKIILVTLLLLIIISIGISRIYVGVHYPSDIIGGYLLAIILHQVINELYETRIGGKISDKDDCK